LWPVPANFDYDRVGVSAAWLAEHGHTGFAAHWQKNSNLAWAFDTWFLNLFSRAKPWVFNGGGYSTISFIPTLGTMVLGLLAGGVLRSERTGAAKVKWLAIAGVVGLGLGVAFHALGICPIVKKIWTPSWVLFSGGWCCLLLAGFYALVDLKGWKGWAFPLVVVGTNSIAAYCIAHLWEGFIGKNLKTHLGQNFFGFAGDYEPFVFGATILLIEWLILLWMQRRKIFLRL
jgi:predicted acyltransferase